MITIITSGFIVVVMLAVLLTFVVGALLCALAGQSKWLVFMLTGVAVFGVLFFKVIGEMLA